MEKKKIENYIVCILIFCSILLFILTPDSLTGSSSISLNDFMDKYMFGNGYYIPPNYPFAAKVTNNFTVTCALVLGILVGIWHTEGVVTPLPKIIWLSILAISLLLFISLHISFEPQEFRENTMRRGFGTSESFHNNPFLFMSMMLAKEFCIYTCTRALTTFSVYGISQLKK